MNLGLPQLIYLAFFIIEFGFVIAKHGTPREGKYNLWITLIEAVIGIYVLYWGGFFN